MVATAGPIVNRAAPPRARTADGRIPILMGAATVAAALLGAGIAISRDAGFLLGFVLLAVATVAVPAGAYVLVALVSALTFKGLVSLGLLPPVAVFLDIPVVWAALAMALMRRRGWSPEAARVIRWLGVLGLAVLAAWAFHPTEVVRPFLVMALLGEPFALVAALLVDPPSRRLRGALLGTALALVLVQIPLSYWQAYGAGVGDAVQGTLLGAGAGAHTMAGVVAVGVIWLLAALPQGASWRLPLVMLLLPIPLLADAKQGLFALPAIVVAGRGRQGWGMFLLRLGVVGGSLTALILLFPLGRAALFFIDRTFTEGGGKVRATEMVVQEITEDPPSFFFGKGPAQTVSRSAFMTTDLFLAADSPLRGFGLEPARIPQEVSAGLPVAGTSFEGGLSSALGVVGDLGVIGGAAYAGLFLTVIRMTHRVRTPEGFAATAGLAVFGVLGLVYDWWEQPPFGVFLAVMAGLALTSERGNQEEETAPPLAVEGHR